MPSAAAQVNPADIHRKAAQIGKLALEMTTAAGSGHPSSSLSLAHIVTTLMYRQMRYDPADPFNLAADRLVLSEGHAVPIVYAAYADLGGAIGGSHENPETSGKLSPADVRTLRELDSVLDGHPNPAEGFPFFDAATGSLGMGLSVAAGLALAAQLQQSPRRIYCIVGDGESREGQIWEAADFITDYKLTRVCAFFNCNAFGQAAHVSYQQSPDRLAAKLLAFGWDVVPIDGHDPRQIADALSQFNDGQRDRPLAIVAKTVKGWGAKPLLQGNWHGKPCPPEELPAAEKSLDETIAALGVNLKEKPAALTPPRPDEIEIHVHRAAPKSVKWPTFRDACSAAGVAKALDTGKVATRRAYGAALQAAGGVLPQVVALDADVSNSTFSEMFGKAHPDRFFECKIGEQNMVSTAAGLSAAGFIPFVNTFAKFVARAYDQVELASISRANIKIVGSHSGISLAADGPSQMSLSDVAFFRSFTTARGDDRVSPVARVFQPADAIAAWHCTRLMCELYGLCYMRTHRPEVPLLYAEDTKFEPGGFHVLSPGDDLALVSSGFEVHVAKEAVALLAKQNIRAALIDLYTLPIDADKLTEALQRCGGRALCVEDNYGGGFGDAVAEIAAAHGGIRVMTQTVQRIPKSARTPEEILQYCGVAAEQIADEARMLLKGGI